ncbi:MAG: hypothetical protein ABW056_06475 [Thermoanaerobaculia bacterium]
MIGFLLQLAQVCGVAAAAWVAGGFASRAACPSDREFRIERIGWSWALGAGLVASMVPIALVARVRPGWPAFLALAAASAAGAWVLRVRKTDPPRAPDGWLERSPERARLFALLGAFATLGVVLYLLRTLTEPMWSNDYVAIWGLKGKTIHAAGEVPSRLVGDPALGFSHPEYPLGLPFLYAGVAFLTGRFDDHAIALLFPLFQIATLCALYGWLRRHGAERVTAAWAAAILACFEPLYSAFTTGLAEVPMSMGLLLFGTALADALEGDPGALRRTALASTLIAATKNEGLFFAAAGCAIALLFGGERRFKAALAALPTALVVYGLHVLWRGRLPLRDFDFGAGSVGRLAEALAAAVRLPGAIEWAQLLLLAALIALGRRAAEGSWMLALCATGFAAYLLLPVFAIRGPEWLIQTALPRTSAALAPLAAGAIAIRFRKVIA